MTRIARSLQESVHEWRAEPQLRLALRGRILHPYRRRQFARFGAGSILHRPDWVYGPSKISVGANCLLLHGLWLSAERQTWHEEGPAIVLGDRVGVRPYCTISAAKSIVIEDNVVISAFTSIIDSNHTFGADGSVLDQPLSCAPVRIGRGTWIGERVAVLPGANIGEQCAIGANSVVRDEIPDRSVAVGAPARVVGSTRDD